MGTDIGILVTGVVIIAAGIGAVLSSSLLVSVILSGAVSLGASLIFLLMGAPDVAMTEAAIGSGLTTVVFLYALSRARQADNEHSDAVHGKDLDEMSESDRKEAVRSAVLAKGGHS